MPGTSVDENRNPKRAKGRRARSRAMRASASYLALVRAYPIHPIQSDDDLDHAIAMVDSLLCRLLDKDEQGYLEVLSHEIERYEAVAYPMPNVSEGAMLRHLMEAHDMNLSQAAEATGIAVSTLSAVLSGKRRLNLSHIRALASCFGIEPAVFLEL